MKEGVLVVEGAGRAIAPDRDIFADDFALSPFLVLREDLGYTDLLWSFVF